MVVVLCVFFIMWSVCCFFFFFFNDTATTEIYTLSLHDALPIFAGNRKFLTRRLWDSANQPPYFHHGRDRKSTRLNSSHGYISYAVFCLKKKKKTKQTDPIKLATSQIEVDENTEKKITSYTLMTH